MLRRNFKNKFMLVFNTVYIICFALYASRCTYLILNSPFLVKKGRNSGEFVIYNSLPLYFKMIILLCVFFIINGVFYCIKDSKKAQKKQ